ncbi:MAG: J domain-containing protein [Roseobacter sp.]
MQKVDLLTNLEKAFQILQVSPSDDAAHIRKAWHAQVRTYHPDMAKSDPVGANKRLSEINNAFDAVSSCTDEDIQNLIQTIAKRARRAAEADQQYRRERRKERASHDAYLSKKPERRKPTDQHKENPSHPTSSLPGVPVAQGGCRRAHKDTEQAETVIASVDLAERALKGFSDGLRICTRSAPTPRRSLYL